MDMKYKLLYWFYPLLFCVAFLQAKAILPPYYLPTEGSLIWPFRLVLLYYGIRAFRMYHNKIPILSVFVVYAIASGIMYIIKEAPLDLYFISCAFFISGVLMAYVGFDISEKIDLFNKIFLYSCLSVFIVGIFLHFYRPDWYTTCIINAYSLKSGETAEAHKILEWVRFGSFLGDSYAIQYLTISSLPICLYFFRLSQKYRKKLYLLCAVFIVLAALLSMQRTAMVCVLFTIFFFIFCYYRKYFFVSVIFLAILVVLLYMIAYYSGQDKLIEDIIDKFSSLSNAYSEREDQRIQIIQHWNNYIFGEGTGIGGGLAVKKGLPGISDGTYFEFLYEYGIVGFLVFMAFIVKLVKKLKSYPTVLFVEICTIFGVLLAMVGASPFVYPFYMIPFWMCAGRVFNKNYIIYRQNNF